MISYIGLILFSALIVLAYETGIAEQGILAADRVVVFYMQYAMELLTICLIPFALRLFKFRKISQSIKLGGEKRLLTWSIIRQNMLGYPLLINALFYEWTLSPVFGYLGIIILLCMCFITPTQSKVQNEYQQITED